MCVAVLGLFKTALQPTHLVTDTCRPR